VISLKNVRFSSCESRIGFVGFVMLVSDTLVVILRES